MPKNKNKGKNGKNGHNTRSTKVYTEVEQPPSSPVPNALLLPSLSEAEGSHTRNDKLPPESVNNNTSDAESVSKQQQDDFLCNTSFHSKNNNYIEKESPGNSIQSSDKNNHAFPNHAVIPKVSDNRETYNQPDPPPEDHRSLLQEGALLTLTSELKAIRSRMDTLDKIELSLSTLVTQFGGLAERTTKVESKVDSHTSSITKVNEAISSLKEEVNLQGSALAKLTTIKSDLFKQNKDVKADLVKQNKGITKEMNQLLDQQRGQVDSFISTTARIEKNISERVEISLEEKLEKKLVKKLEDRLEEKLKKELEKKLENRCEENISERVRTSLEEEMERGLEAKLEEKINARLAERAEEKDKQISNVSSFQSLKDQAFSKRHNIVVMGLEEDDNRSVSSAVKDFLKSFGVDKIGIRDAYRIGQRQSDNTSYRRPIVVEFYHLSDRNKVWRKRRQIPSVEGELNVRIQADLPKLLRDEINILYRIKRAASNFPEFQSASISDFALQLNGREFSPFNLELLPLPLRPSTISNPRSGEAVVFFSKYSPLSNHHPSPFTLQGQSYQNLEQYLAVQRATVSGQESTIRRASAATDPKEAKGILRSLRESHPQDWAEKVENVTLEGLRAKFSQNAHLLSFLKNTKSLQIGEASRDVRWGIGLELNDPAVLDISKWNSSGNLLGKCLMKVRDELSAPT